MCGLESGSSGLLQNSAASCMHVQAGRMGTRGLTPGGLEAIAGVLRAAASCGGTHLQAWNQPPMTSRVPLMYLSLEAMLSASSLASLLPASMASPVPAFAEDCCAIRACCCCCCDAAGPA